MKQKTRKHHHWFNRIQTFLLLISMAGLLSILGWFLAGPAGIKAAMIVTVLAFVFTPRLPSRFVMRSMNARPLNPRVTAELHTIARQLARKAGLETNPVLYYLPTAKLNAFAVGDSKDSAIGITHGLLSALNTREMAGILSHEITHIKNKDMEVMALSAVFGRITGYLSVAGQILLVLSLPFMLVGQTLPSLLPLLFVVLAPAASTMLYLALSRTREFEADLGSVTLLNDPHALASALSKVEQFNTRSWKRLFIPMPARQDHAPLLQSHPPTRERIRRLLAMAPPPKPRKSPLGSGRRVVLL